MPATTPKQATLDLVRRLSDDASFEDIHYEIYVLQKVEQGLLEVEAGETVSHEEARQHLQRWLGDTGTPSAAPRG
jgi:predicted transcriptional regulator